MIFAAGPAASHAARDIALKPFSDVFPAGNIHHHFAGQEDKSGVYAKETHIPAGFVLVSHRHPYDHISILAHGTVRLTVGSDTREVTGPTCLTIRKGEEHAILAITYAVWFCIHPTQETDGARVDHAILHRKVG